MRFASVLVAASLGFAVCAAAEDKPQTKPREHVLARTEVEAIRSLQARSADLNRREQQIREEAKQLEADTAAVNSEILAAHGVAPGAKVELRADGVLIER